MDETKLTLGKPQGTFTVDTYELEGAEKTKLLYQAMQVMDFLSQQGYNCVFRYEDMGIYVVEYGYDVTNDFGGDWCAWVNVKQD